MDVRLYSGGFRRLQRSHSLDNFDFRQKTASADLAKTIYNAAERKPSRSKAVAFDLDETLGSFADLHSIWTMIGREHQTQKIFDDAMDLYPEFLRVGILPILEFLSSKIAAGECLPIYIYTNNQCEDQSWIERLINYLETRIHRSNKSRLFAHPICAFKVKTRRLEPNRTTHEKTYDDFVKCSMLKRAEVCFVDDLYHNKMDHRRVYYIQPPPYHHGLTYKQIVDRYLNSELWRKIHRDYESSVFFDEEENPRKTSESKVLRVFSFKPPSEQIIRPTRPSSHSLFESGILCSPEFEANCSSSNRNGSKKEQEIAAKIMYYVREFFFVSSRRHFTKKRQKILRGVSFTKKKR
jgi:hypothetical protein